ncbi:MAG: nucleotidyltransferase family protein [Armatimonadota bacterium]
MALQIAVPQNEIEAFCRKWQIQERAIFGSALRDDFRADSDADVLVTFQPGVHWGFGQLLEMTHELDRLFGRPVDLVERPLVEASKNYIRRKHILSHLERIYVA